MNSLPKEDTDQPSLETPRISIRHHMRGLCMLNGHIFSPENDDAIDAHHLALHLRSYHQAATTISIQARL
jgi:hypothetical protein